MYGGIYQRIRHPQAVGEFPFWWVIAFLVDSPFLAIVSFLYVPVWYYMCCAEEKDLLIRYGDSYAEYMKRVGFWFPKRRIREGTIVRRGPVNGSVKRPKNLGDFMKKCRELAVWLYIINLSLLGVHEIDSAYWHEWEMFRLPGDIQFFLVLNLLLLILLIYGLARVVRWEPGAKVFSYIIAGAGIFAFLIHATFLAAGRDEFRSPVSVALLVGTLLVSIAQIVVVARCDKPLEERAA